MRINVDVISANVRMGAMVKSLVWFPQFRRVLEGTPNEGPLIGFACAASPPESPYLADGSVDPVSIFCPEVTDLCKPTMGCYTISRIILIWLASTFLEIDLYAGLKFKINVWIPVCWSSRHWRPWWVGLATSLDSPSGTGYVGSECSRSDQSADWKLHNLQRYTKDDHGIEIPWANSSKQDYDIVSASATRFSDDRIPLCERRTQEISNGKRRKRCLQVPLPLFSAGDYPWLQEPLLLECHLRRDGSSRFHLMQVK